MEALLTLAFAGWLGKKTVEAVVGGGNKESDVSGKFYGNNRKYADERDEDIKRNTYGRYRKTTYNNRPDITEYAGILEKYKCSSDSITECMQEYQ